MTWSLVLLVVSSIWAQPSWELSAAEAERRAADLDSLSDAKLVPLGGPRLESRFVVENTCAVVGRMIGRTADVDHLPTPVERSVDDYHLRDQAAQYRSLAAAIRKAAAMPVDRLRSLWAIQCVGRFGIRSAARSGELQPAFFDVDGTTLRVLGDVTTGFAERLLAALDAHPDVSTVALGSRGGNVYEAMVAGAIIRQRQIDTTLFSGCYSACPLVFMGGVKREIRMPVQDLGFHQISDESGAVSLGSQVYEDVREYLDLVGADSDWVMKLMLSASPATVEIPMSSELCAHGVASFVQGSCITRKPKPAK